MVGVVEHSNQGSLECSLLVLVDQMDLEAFPSVVFVVAVKDAVVAAFAVDAVGVGADADVAEVEIVASGAVAEIVDNVENLLGLDRE